MPCGHVPRESYDLGRRKRRWLIRSRSDAHTGQPVRPEFQMPELHSMHRRTPNLFDGHVIRIGCDVINPGRCVLRKSRPGSGRKPLPQVALGNSGWGIVLLGERGGTQIDRSNPVNARPPNVVEVDELSLKA
jgi:hypothetical protein